MRIIKSNILLVKIILFISYVIFVSYKKQEFKFIGCYERILASGDTAKLNIMNNKQFIYFPSHKMPIKFIKGFWKLDNNELILNSFLKDNEILFKGIESVIESDSLIFEVQGMDSLNLSGDIAVYHNGDITKIIILNSKGYACIPKINIDSIVLNTEYNSLLHYTPLSSSANIFRFYIKPYRYKYFNNSIFKIINNELIEIENKAHYFKIS